ncbi:N-acetyltransferase [Jiulongibacter sp. NS-SX5]|uniref:N-acetyltransferase n=1 Tax=Jiulongibacter sp. NS-SX5 TaxID=3463854 RepID=UPI004059598D
MKITERKTGVSHKIKVTPVSDDDFSKITEERYWFKWKEEKGYNVFKLQIIGKDDILGLISLEIINKESRIEIRLLAVSKENRGSQKAFEEIAGNLIAFAGIESIRVFGELACISLIPKTELIDHYKQEYGMLEAGKSLFLDGKELIALINKYDND